MEADEAAYAAGVEAAKANVAARRMVYRWAGHAGPWGHWIVDPARRAVRRRRQRRLRGLLCHQFSLSFDERDNAVLAAEIDRRHGSGAFEAVFAESRQQTDEALWAAKQAWLERIRTVNPLMAPTSIRRGVQKTWACWSAHRPELSHDRGGGRTALPIKDAEPIHLVYMCKSRSAQRGGPLAIAALRNRLEQLCPHDGVDCHWVQGVEHSFGHVARFTLGSLLGELPFAGGLGSGEQREVKSYWGDGTHGCKSCGLFIDPALGRTGMLKLASLAWPQCNDCPRLC